MRDPPAEHRLIARDEQRRRLDDLTASARAGHGGALLVFGEPGIGKSVLLADAAGRVADMRVLSVTGLASDAELPYGGLAQLLAPILPDRGRLAPIQTAALESALGLGPPSRADRLALLMAVVSLLTAAAAQTPLLVLVDDLQWVDEASARALRFAAPHTAALPIALVLAGRERVDWPGVDTLELPGLAREAALELLRGRVSGAVADRLVAATGGNPLALLEAPRQLTSGQRSGAVPLTSRCRRSQPGAHVPRTDRGAPRRHPGCVARGRGERVRSGRRHRRRAGGARLPPGRPPGRGAGGPAPA